MKNGIRNFLNLLALLAWSLTSNAQFNFTNDNGAVTITDYIGTNWFVVIPSTIDGLPVTKIGDNTFATRRIAVTNVIIPDSVTSIGARAFYFCNFLTSVTVGNRVTSIGDEAFRDCRVLTSVTIPNSVTSIGANAFYGCGLKNVTIGNSVTNIGDAFLGCPALTNFTVAADSPAYSTAEGVLFDKTQATLVQFPMAWGSQSLNLYAVPSSVTSIGNNAFEGCRRLALVTIPNSVTNLGKSSFAGCSLRQVTIPDSVTSIGNNAFFKSERLTGVTIGNAVASIGTNAFANCPILHVTIPDGVTSIGESCFEGSLGSVNIGNSVTNIGARAFRGSSLVNVTIPNSVTSIGNGAFSECLGLTNFTVAAGNPAYHSADGVLFDRTRATLVQFPAGRDGNYTIPNSVTSIGDHAFESCTGLMNVAMGNGLTSIGNYAFVQCTGLTTVAIPDSVTTIGNGAFALCLALTNVTIGNSVTSIGDFAFWGQAAAYFRGNAPSTSDAGSVFFGAVYYLPGTTGWGEPFGGRLPAPWSLPHPVILSSGLGSNPFSFTISWATNHSVVVQATTNLANPIWTSVTTNTLAHGTNYFTDPAGTAHPRRFYRVTTP